MSQNLKIRRSPKAGYCHIQKYCGKYVTKNKLLSNCHVKFIFPLALAVKGSALGLIFFGFHYVC